MNARIQRVSTIGKDIMLYQCKQSVMHGTDSHFFQLSVLSLLTILLRSRFRLSMLNWRIESCLRDSGWLETQHTSVQSSLLYLFLLLKPFPVHNLMPSASTYQATESILSNLSVFSWQGGAFYGSHCSSNWPQMFKSYS